MPRRIEVELTSRRDDGTWTWRAAGAREPRGTVDATLLPGEAAVGMVLKAEVEIDMEGIVVTAVTPPKAARSEPQRLEIMGGSRGDEELVTTSLVRRGPGERRPRRDRGDRPDRPERPGGDRDRANRPRGEGDRRGRPEAGGERRRPPFERKAPLEPKPRAKRLRAGRQHRNELIAGLPEEHRPIAEELIRAGVPGVRTALEKQNEQAKAEGRPEIDPAPLVQLAEQLWPQVRAADWRDRAEGALGDVDELDLRDLRSVVVAADGAARDDDSRALATQLREALNRRVDEEHTKWLEELSELTTDGRVVAALRRSSRPPKAGAPLPAELAATLATQTGAALAADTPGDRWAVVLDALSFSPVRTSVTPAGVPEEPSEELLAAVRKSASRLPAIAALFGIEAEASPAPGGRTRRPRPGGRPEGAPPRIPAPPRVAPEAPTAGRAAPAAPTAADVEPPTADQAVEAASPPSDAPAEPLDVSTEDAHSAGAEAEAAAIQLDTTGGPTTARDPGEPRSADAGAELARTSDAVDTDDATGDDG